MKKAHFIGICGIGMSAVALLLKEAGWEVSGSDDEFYPPASEYLRELKISFNEGYSENNIPPDADVIIIGKNAKLTRENNEEVGAAFQSGKTIRSFPEVLGSLFSESENIVVAGSYAKSTCTALLSSILVHSGIDPSYFIGAVPIGDLKTAHQGKKNITILEGDEYPSSNWDETSKFLYYHPRDVLLTSTAHDHVNVFPTHDEYLTPFKTLLSLIPEDGLLVASYDDESSRALAHTHPSKTVLYGMRRDGSSHGTWSARDMSYGNKTAFTLTKGNEDIVRLETTLLGEHNVQNIVGVSAMLLEKQLVTPEKLEEGVRAFKGVSRRLNLLSHQSSVKVYEGFGSSYEKARASIKALKTHYPDQRLVVVFEPHTFSWRNKDALHWYDSVFEEVDTVLVYEPTMQGADTHKQLAQEEIVDRIRKTGVEVCAILSSDDALDYLSNNVREDDVILLSTSGDLGGLIEKIPHLVEVKFPKR